MSTLGHHNWPIRRLAPASTVAGAGVLNASNRLGAHRSS